MQTLMIDMAQLLPMANAVQAPGPGAGKTDFAQMLQLFADSQGQAAELLSPFVFHEQNQGGLPTDLFAPLADLLQAQLADLPQELQAQSPELQELFFLLQQGVLPEMPVAQALNAPAQQQNQEVVPAPVLGSKYAAAPPAPGAQFTAQHPFGGAARPDPAPQAEMAQAESVPRGQVSGTNGETTAPGAVIPVGRRPGDVLFPEARAVVLEPTADQGRRLEPEAAPLRTLRQDLGGRAERELTDARFAALIAPRTLQGEAPRVGEGSRLDAFLSQAEAAGEDSSRVQGAASRQGQSDLGSLLHRGAPQSFPLPAAAPPAETGTAFSVEAQRAQTAGVDPTPSQGLKLPSGATVPENHVLNQVMERLQVRNTGERSVMTLRLNPKELGELRMELVMEKGVLKAQILAQNTQVQEVLERNLFRLREALEGQGVKIESFEVGLDDGRRNGGQHGFEQRPEQAFEEPRKAVRVAADLERESERPAAVTGAGAGINLRI
ncbi:hook-length control protein FliK [Geoalkalibacter ferrihydriticus]|uniref:Flagellar hook-length control protein-like C-terminal domain-containing protein n=2 Tax=Geoalkalibacter ferrihydriticus TaxID=392333 RepID=A0A0C2DVU0_9BACT|nr:flagellar hook-length control protein FliK [Geoalkalibacter ferrihydriticus]KIH77564.1 hypothetical protein GFER_02435 [Geoalkalibacter ferrihydriticus DSM 17813]SDL68330.1 hook-length control protein FliK [Geoalkalibacter ferrihydriticus]